MKFKFPGLGLPCVIVAVAALVFVTDTHAARRVIILGFDGVEPTIVDAMMDKGELPHLKAVMDEGVYTRLKSSNPPQSPTAWTSFATSKHPGNHGVYDFLRRNPQNYIPGVGFGSVVKPKLRPDGALEKAPYFKTVRKGTSFWVSASEQGARCKILSVPFSFPAEDLQDGCMLSGLGVPDIRGTTSTFFLMSDMFEKPESLSGGKKLPLVFDGNTAKVTIEGLRHPAARRFVAAPITISADRVAHTLEVSLGEQKVTVAEGSWSPWLEWTFDVSPKYAVRAISRIHVLEAGEQVRLYMTCLQFHPRDPYIRFTTPPNYGGQLADRYGFFKTIGWIYDTHALRQDALTEDLFLEDISKTMAWRETLTLDELDRGNFDLLVSAWTGTDRVAHLFWRFRDPGHPAYTEEGARAYGRSVETTYQRMDETVGKVRERLQDGDLLMILSDHGFHSFRKGFNVNTWLVRNGYLGVAGRPDPATAFNDKPWLRGYDWRRTQAYGLGLGSIFLNLQGREGEGIVPPEEAGALISEIREKLLKVKDPETGAKIFSAIYTRDDYQGIAQGDAPDLQLGYAEGYQSTKNAAKGAAPRELFEVNNDKWSGEHAASDTASTPGVFFANQAIAVKEPRLVDLGVTALTYLGKTVPSDFEGVDLFSP